MHTGDELATLLRTLDVPADARLLRALVLALARLGPLVFLSPLFGAEIAPRRFRVGVLIVLACVLAPLLASSGADPGHPLALLAAKEVLVGFTLFVLVAALFGVYQSAGSLIDASRGASFAEMIDPVSNQRDSVMASFLRVAALTVFTLVGGHRIVLEALALSYRAVPAFGLAPPQLAGQGSALGLVGIIATVVTAALLLAGPVIACALALDVSLGVLSRAARGFEGLYLGFAAKNLVLLLVLAGSITVAFGEPMQAFARVLSDWASRGGHP